MQKSAFKDWTQDQLEEVFGINQVSTLPCLESWLTDARALDINETEHVLLTQWQKQYLYRGSDWNEAELIEHFIAPIFSLIGFNTNEFGLFVERPLSAVIDDYELSGAPDAIIASGRRKPKIPYFCFSEYKKEKDPFGDPAAQTLVAMMVAQELNQNQRPIYGLFVIGEKWKFMALRGKEYAISHSFTADSDTLWDIFKLLKRLKQIIVAIHQPPLTQ